MLCTLSAFHSNHALRAAALLSFLSGACVCIYLRKLEANRRWWGVFLEAAQAIVVRSRKSGRIRVVVAFVRESSVWGGAGRVHCRVCGRVCFS